jgi:hypothetical protein
MKQKHNNYLDGLLTITHECFMASAKAKMDYLKHKGKWGAKSPDNEKIVAMAVKINALKGQFKLGPKLSAIAEDKKRATRVRKARSSRTKRTLQT